MSLMSWPGLNQQPLSGYAHSYQPQGCCASCCRCSCHHRHITYTPPMMPGSATQPWGYQAPQVPARGDNVVDFTDAPASMAMMVDPD
jgi:hypothetical protein